MTQKAHIVHHIPGRLRLRVPHRRDDTDFFEEVLRRFLTCDSVTKVDVNPSTAGILLHYDAALPVLLLEAAEAGLTELADIELGLQPLVPISEHLTTRLGDVDRQISQFTQGTVNGTTVVILFLLLAGGLQVLRGRVLGSAVPLLWYAWQAVRGLPTQHN